jgi:YegS/Rv2252/BmrU family lipid kinase
MNYKIIANPIAGKGTGEQLIPKVEERLREYRLDFNLSRTERPWHAAELAYQAVHDGYDVIVASGGDGTCNEVINGLMMAAQETHKTPTLGLISIGRGNDFAYGTGIPRDWEGGCKALIENKRRLIDVGRLTGDGVEPHPCRYIGNGLGIGFDAMVNVLATRSQIHGTLGYALAAIQTIALYFNAPTLHIELDNEIIEHPSLMTSIMNGRRMGGGFLLTPEGLVDDGLFDLCIAQKVSRLTIIKMLPRFMKGTQAGHPAVYFTRSKKVHVTALDGTFPYHVDGETLSTHARDLTVEILPAALNLIY